MKQHEKEPTGLLHSITELRQLIIDNPELPLVVMAGRDANTGDYELMACDTVLAHIGEFLDCYQDINGCVCYTDRDAFRADLEDLYYDYEGSEEELEAFLNVELLEYEPYWKKCIILEVDN